MLIFALFGCMVPQREVVYTARWNTQTPPSIRVCRNLGFELHFIQDILADIEDHGGPHIPPDQVRHAHCPDDYHPLPGTITLHAMFWNLFEEDKDRVGVTIPSTPASCKALDSYNYTGDCTIEEASIFLVDMGRGTVRHELIHALGVLGHSADERSPMYVYSRGIGQQDEWTSTEQALRRIWPE